MIVRSNTFVKALLLGCLLLLLPSLGMTGAGRGDQPAKADATRPSQQIDQGRTASETGDKSISEKSTSVSRQAIRDTDTVKVVAKPKLPAAAPVSTLSTRTGEQINWQVISSGGTDGNSASYTLAGTVGQTATGYGSSASYGLSHGFWQDFGASAGTCCADTMVGDVNCADDPGVPDIADMQRLIDFLFIAMDSVCCIEEADVDASGQGHPPAIEDDVDIADMQLLIDHLFIDMEPLPSCP